MSHIDRVGNDRRFWVNIYNIAKNISPRVAIMQPGAICYTSIYLLLLWHHKAIEITTDKIANHKARIEHQDIHNVLCCV